MAGRLRGQAGILAGELAQALAVARSHPFAVAAFALNMLWATLAFLAPVARARAAMPTAGLLLSVVVPYACVGVACLALSLSFRRWRFELGGAWVRPVEAGCMSMGTLCAAAVLESPSVLGPAGAQAAGWLTYGVGCSCLAAGVALFRVDVDRMLGWLGSRKALLVVCAGILLAAPFAALALGARPAWALPASAALPPLACAALRLETRGFPQRRYYRADKDISLPTPTQFIATSFFQGMASGVSCGAVFAGAGGGLALAGPLCAAAWPAGVALALAAVSFARLDFNRMLYKLGFPLLSLGFLLCALWPQAAAGDAVGAAAATFLDAVLWSLGAFIIRDMGAPACWIASYPGAALYGGTAAGALAVWLLALAGADGRLLEVELPLAAAGAMLGASLLLLSEKNMRSGWGTCSIGSRPDAETSLGMAVAYLAGEHGLTAREADVVRALARGGSRADAADALGVGEETVKTHLRSVYRKLDVHSIAELAGLVGRTVAQLGEDEGGR